MQQRLNLGFLFSSPLVIPNNGNMEESKFDEINYQEEF